MQVVLYVDSWYVFHDIYLIEYSYIHKDTCYLIKVIHLFCSL